MSKIDLVSKIYQIILDYEENTNDKPYIMLISPETYIELREYLEYLEYLEKNKRYINLNNDIEKIKFLFGIPVEISSTLVSKVKFMSITDYIKYCKRNNHFYSSCYKTNIRYIDSGSEYYE